MLLINVLLEDLRKALESFKLNANQDTLDIVKMITGNIDSACQDYLDGNA